MITSFTRCKHYILFMVFLKAIRGNFLKKIQLF